MMVHIVYVYGAMKELSQQELLLALKNALDVTWDEVAAHTGIAPRALKSYRLPVSSTGYRGMDKFVRDVAEKALFETKNKHGITA
ncbi:hypothetical protein RBA41_23940 [Massilia sp. CCM 9210]|uniref:hypothetical protein n=1 Tax=Massilia scottii TaxID=3057166 RepID=UPI0027968A2C|nr:hypothetical protein [Massilia sp. CCM 9210]MDQ1816353.1 hypothetical protein [Massilia sp. CCM 9210]